MARKKKTEEQIIEEVSKLIAEETLTIEKTKSKKTKEIWPKVIQGSHSLRTEYQDGRIEFVTDWDALTRDVKQALLEYESTIPVSDTKVEKIKKTKNKKV